MQNPATLRTFNFIRYFRIVIILGFTLILGCRKEDSDSDPVPIPVLSTSVSDVNESSALCTGTVTSDVDIGNILYCGICYSNVTSEPSKSGTTEMTFFNSQNRQFQLVLNYLTPGITYHVRAYAENETGAGYGNEVVFTTMGDITGDIEFNTDLVYNTVNDIDGNSYRTIQIGDQEWMAENLKTTKLNDGTDIQLIQDQTEWVYNTGPGYSWYLNDETKYKNAYGVLYNWYAAKSDKLCPAGWHVPSKEEWLSLSSYLGENLFVKTKEPGTAHWVTTETEADNSSGFTALPGGYRNGSFYEPYPEQDYFINLGYVGAFWSTDTQASWYELELIDFGSSWDFSDFGNEYSCGLNAHYKSSGLSVRCIKNQ
jgi:uncharacterized protein (TIGR02145 family)